MRIFDSHDHKQEDKQWDLTEEIVADLKEIFILFDTDTDGVLTIEQVYQAMNVMGMRRPGNIFGSVSSSRSHNLRPFVWS